MTSTHHSQYPLLHIDLNQDQDHQPILFSPKPAELSSLSSSSSSNLLYPIFINPNEDGGGYYHQGSTPLQSQEEADTNVPLGQKCDDPTLKHGNYGRIKLSLSKKEEGMLNGNKVISEGINPAKWMSSKMRLMRKMVSSDQMVGDIPESSIKKVEDNKDLPKTSPFQTDDSNNNNNSVRVCADCNTTKTPLWRSGPRGPKSLCNACGIRQRKARRAMAAAAVVAAGVNGAVFEPNNTPAPTSKTKVQKKEKKESDSHLPLKKRCKFTSQGRGRSKKLCFEELSIILSKKYSAFQQVFPQDEKEAAILLMALSYGLVHG